MQKAASYVKPSGRAWYWNLALIIIYLSAAWTFVAWVEKKNNPVDWDLETFQHIRNLQEQMAKRAGEE